MGLYKIKDNYIRFWFKFVYPYKSYIESEHIDFVLDKIKEGFIKIMLRMCMRIFAKINIFLS